MPLAARVITRLAGELLARFAEERGKVGFGFLDEFLEDEDSEQQFKTDIKGVLRRLDDLGKLPADATATVDTVLEAIQRFQEQQGIVKDFGIVGPKTIGRVSTNFCVGTQSKDEAETAGAGPVTTPVPEADSTLPERPDFTYFVESIPDIDGGDARQELSDAMAEWVVRANLPFKFLDITDTGAAADAHMLVRERPRIDGPSGTLALTTVGPPGGVQLIMAFDGSDEFVAGGNPSLLATGKKKNFFAVALHELGHALGLCHGLPGCPNWSSSAVMFDTYDGTKELLTPEDIAHVKRTWNVS